MTSQNNKRERKRQAHANSEAPSFFMEDFPTPFGEEDLVPSRFCTTKEAAAIPGGMAGAGLNTTHGLGQSPLLADRTNSNSLYHLQDQQDISGFMESMPYREPFSNRQLHENGVYPPNAQNSNNLKGYVSNHGPTGLGGQYRSPRVGGQPDSLGGNYGQVPLQQNHPLLIDPDQVLNAPQGSGMPTGRMPGANLSHALQPAPIDPMQLSNGIPAMSNQYGSGAPRKTSAQALFSSDGEDGVPDATKQFLGNRADIKGSRPYFGAVNSTTSGESLVAEALSQNQLMGQMGQQSIIAIQYLKGQLQQTQQALVAAREAGKTPKSQSIALMTDRQSQTEAATLTWPSEDALTENRNDKSSKVDRYSTDNASETPATRVEYQENPEKIGRLFDQKLFAQINGCEHIVKTEEELEELKVKFTDKKLLQRERNILTAQLSRDRKKLEVELLRLSCVQLTETLNKVRNTLIRLECNKTRCKKCGSHEIASKIQADLQFVMKSGHEYKMSFKKEYGSDTQSQDENDATHNPESKGQTAAAAAELSDSLSQSQETRKGRKIEFKKYAKKPGLVKRLTRVKTSQSKNKSNNDPEQELRDIEESQSFSQSSRKMQRVDSDRDMTTAAPQVREQELALQAHEQQASAQSEPTQQPRHNNPGLSVAPVLSQGGGGLSKAGVSLASMMAVALLGTLALGQNPQSIAAPPLNDEFEANMNSDGSEIPNGRMDQEGLGITGMHFVRRNLVGFGRSSDSDDEEEENGLTGEAPMEQDKGYERRVDVNDPLYDDQHLQLPKVDAIVPAPPAPPKALPPGSNLTAEGLDALCEQIDFSNVKYAKHFYKVQELRDDFLNRKLKELCEERLIFKGMNASEEADASLSPGFLQIDPPAGAATGSGLVPRKPRPSYRSYEDETCDAEERYQEDACEATHSDFMDLQKRTTTLYTEKPIMILPTDEYGGAGSMFNPDDGTDQYFQIVLPVKNIKIINGMTGREFTSPDEGAQWSDRLPSNQSLGRGTSEDAYQDRDKEFSHDAFNRRRGGQGYLEISCKSFDIHYL